MHFGKVAQRRLGRIVGHSEPAALTVRDTSDMGTQSGCKCLLELLFPSSSTRYAGSSNRRFTPQKSETCPRWGAKTRIGNAGRPAVNRVNPPESVVRLCYYVVVRTTLDISDEAYYIAKAIARDRNRSLGRVVGDLILQSSKGAKGASIKMSDYGFPTFRCARPVTTEDVKALDDEE